MLATSLVLCAAVLHATWNTLVKFSSDRLLVVACMDVVGVLCAILLLPFVSLPPAEVWPWLLGATVLQLLYRVLLIEAYKVGDLGLVYPLMRGLSPLVVLGLTLAFGGEQLSGRQILGILLIPFGMLCLLWGGGGSRLPWRTLPVVLLIGLCIGGYTWSDGNALKRWPLALDYLVWLTLLSGLPFPLIAVGARTRAFARFWALEWKLGLAVGVCVLASYGLVLWAMQLGSIAEAAALRETSVLLAVLFGMRFLNEPFGLPRLLACGLVLAGMLLMEALKGLCLYRTSGASLSCSSTTTRNCHDHRFLVRADRDLPALRLYLHRQVRRGGLRRSGQRRPAGVPRFARRLSPACQQRPVERFRSDPGVRRGGDHRPSGRQRFAGDPG